MRTVIDIDQNRLIGVGVRGRGGRSRRPEVVRRVEARVPGDIAPGDASAFGAWIGAELRSAGLGRGGVVMVVPRVLVALKLLSFPTSGRGPSDRDLPGMVRLEMSRQLTIPAEQASLDAVRLRWSPVAGGENVDGTSDGAGASTRAWVLAGALSGDEVGRYRSIASAARVRLTGLALRSGGLTDLLSADGDRDGDGEGGVLGGDAVLVVVPGPTAVEFAIVCAGELLFARGVAMEAPGEGAAEPELASYAERVAVEAKRTWMSFRVTTPGAPVESGVVLAGEPMASRLAALSSRELEMDVLAPGLESLCPGAGEASWWSAGVVASLAGVGCGRAGSRLDFLNPRRTPDHMASSRRILAAAGVAGAVGLGAGWLWSQDRLADLDLAVLEAEDELGEARRVYGAYAQLHARVSFAEAWIDAGRGWIGDLGPVMRSLPDPHEARLAEFRAGVEPGFENYAVRRSGDGERGDYPGAWVGFRRLNIAVKGSAENRGLANETHARLIGLEGFRTYRADRVGPDVGGGFEIRIAARTMGSASRPGSSAPTSPTSAKAATTPTGGGPADGAGDGAAGGATASGGGAS